MKIDIKNMNLTDVGVGVSLPKGSNADLKMDEITMIRGRTLVEERDAPNFVQSLGLPPDTPPEFILEIIRELRERPDLLEHEKVEVVKSSKLWSFVERSSSATTVIQGILALTAAAFGIPSAT